MKTDLKVLFKELKQYEGFATLSDGEKQADDKVKKENKEKGKVLTADVIRKMSDEYEPKNNWNRYFSDKLSVKGPNKFSKDWGSLYDIRNKVAHGKPINKADFKKANELIELFTKAFDECIEIMDTLEMTVEEAEAVEAVAQQVIQKKKTNAFERENLSAEIKSYPYNGKVDLENLSGGLKIIGEAIGSSSLPSVPDSVFKSANALSSTVSALVKSNSLTIDNEELVRGAKVMSEMLAPLSSQITISPKFSESLKVDRITAALDKPIVIDSPLDKVEVNGNIDLVAKQKTDFLGVETTDTKVQISSPENQKNGKE